MWDESLVSHQNWILNQDYYFPTENEKLQKMTIIHALLYKFNYLQKFICVLVCVQQSFLQTSSDWSLKERVIFIDK